MKLLKDGVLYDSTKGADLIIKAESATGTRTLLIGRNNGRFFELFKEGALPEKILPMGAPAAFDFCKIYESQFAPGEYRKMMLKYFQTFFPKEKKMDLSQNSDAYQIGAFDGVTLWHTYRARVFYLETNDEIRPITENEALAFVELHQEGFPAQRLKTILKNIFPTLMSE